VGLTHRAIERYLADRLGGGVRLMDVRPLGTSADAPGDLKGFGYGAPLELAAWVGGERRSFVLARMREAEGYGHDYPADRAHAMLLGHAAYNALPRHVRSLDVGFVTHGGEVRSAGDAAEFFQLVEKAEGAPYRRDLEAIAGRGQASPLDLARAEALAAYLAEIHAVRRRGAQLYRRRVRELIGHGEGIMGVLDGYPDPPPRLPAFLAEVERRAIGWRWRLRDRAHRLALVHGDFHPWNILFREGVDFALLDRSRGEWGEPADDVAALTVNYLFFALRGGDRFAGPFRALFDRCLEKYLAVTADGELAEVAAPFYAFRALVLASPVWYPSIPAGCRRALLGFAAAALRADRLDWHRFGDLVASPGDPDDGLGDLADWPAGQR
jgi:hypothetical protein